MPLRRSLHSRMVGTEADAPDPVARTGFDEHAVTGPDKVARQRFVGTEFCHRPTAHDVEPMLVPDLVAKSSDLSAKLFRFARAGSVQNQTEVVLIVEKSGLLRHHVVLGGGIAHPVVYKPVSVPLAEYVDPDLA